MKLLLISDSKLMQLFIEKIMNRFGCHVISYPQENIQGILSDLKSSPIDYVIIDETYESAQMMDTLTSVLKHIPPETYPTPVCLLIKGDHHDPGVYAKKFMNPIKEGRLAFLPRDTVEPSLRKFFENLMMGSVPFLDARLTKYAGFSILVALESSELASDIQEALSKTGIPVLIATDFTEALQSFEETEPQVVITDILFRDKDHTSFCVKVKTSERVTSVLVLSDRSQQETINEAYNSGADDYLIKPVPMDQLVLKVMSIIDSILDKSESLILIVDDDRFMRENFRRKLVSENMSVVTAENGIEGLSVAMIEQPAIIITDVEMPFMNGYELLEAVRQMKALEQTIVIIASGTFNRKGLKRYANHTTVQCFPKPVDMEKLIMLIEQLMTSKAILFKKENELFLSGIASLINAIEARDEYTKGHSERVTRYAVEIGKVLNLTARQLKFLELAASLHDLGKIGIRDDVLLKSQSLSPDEFEIIKGHSTIGSNMISSAKNLGRLPEVVMSHHERFDGTGYPKGLKGSEILLEARIIAVADTFDAVTTSRPYRKTPMEKEKAVQLVKSLSGTQLCPQCVEAFLSFVEKDI